MPYFTSGSRPISTGSFSAELRRPLQTRTVPDIKLTQQNHGQHNIISLFQTLKPSPMHLDFADPNSFIPREVLADRVGSFPVSSSSFRPSIPLGLSLALLLFVLPGCSTTKSPNPEISPAGYSTGVAVSPHPQTPGILQEKIGDVVLSQLMPTPSSGDMKIWQSWKTQFISREKGKEGLVIDPSQGNQVVSEGQGYGLFLAVAHGDQQTFSELYQATKTHFIKGNGLLRWKAGSEDSASDADVYTAMSLLIAGKKWSNQDYTQDAKTMISNIWDNEVTDKGGRLLIKPSDGRWPVWGDGRVVYNPSYFIPSAFRMFAAVDSNDWSKLADDGYTIADAILDHAGNIGAKGQNPFPKEVLLLDAGGQLGVENYYEKPGIKGNKAVQDGNNEMDAIRIPLELGRDSISTGNSKAAAVLNKFLEKAGITGPSSAKLLGYNNEFAIAMFGVGVKGSGKDAAEYTTRVAGARKATYFGYVPADEKQYYKQSLVLMAYQLLTGKGKIAPSNAQVKASPTPEPKETVVSSPEDYRQVIDANKKLVDAVFVSLSAKRQNPASEVHSALDALEYLIDSREYDFAQKNLNRLINPPDNNMKTLLYGEYKPSVSSYSGLYDPAYRQDLRVRALKIQGVLYLRTGQTVKAEQLFKQALDLAKKTNPETLKQNQPQLVADLHVKHAEALIWSQKGQIPPQKLNEALKELEAAGKLENAANSPWIMAELNHTKADILLQLAYAGDPKKFDEAAACFKAALKHSGNVDASNYDKKVRAAKIRQSLAELYLGKAARNKEQIAGSYTPSNDTDYKEAEKYLDELFGGKKSPSEIKQLIHGIVTSSGGDHKSTQRDTLAKALLRKAETILWFSSNSDGPYWKKAQDYLNIVGSSDIPMLKTPEFQAEYLQQKALAELLEGWNQHDNRNSSWESTLNRAIGHYRAALEQCKKSGSSYDKTTRQYEIDATIKKTTVAIMDIKYPPRGSGNGSSGGGNGVPAEHPKANSEI